MQRNSRPHSGPNQPAAAQTVNTKRESLLPCPQTSATALSATGVMAICSLAGSAACNTASITASIFGQSDAPHAAAHQGKRGRAQRGAGQSDAGGAGCTDGDKADRHAIGPSLGSRDHQSLGTQHYSFSVPESVARGELRPLRDPADESA